MNLKTINLFIILATFGIIAAGIMAIYVEDILFTSIGLYFISKGFFVISLMRKIQSRSNLIAVQITQNLRRSKAYFLTKGRAVLAI
jgi:hypothetical protein